MRNISDNAIAKITQQYGAEPISIIGVDWAGTGNVSWYADRDLPGIPGKILEMSEIEDVVGVSDNSTSQQVTIKLADTDGTIKTVLDSYDIHLQPCIVYQYFEGLDLADKFIVFEGKINTPVEWTDAMRCVTITVISQLEDVEIGYTPEQGQFSYISPDLIGQAWPMCFGTPVNVKCVQLEDIKVGILGDGVNIPGPSQYVAGQLPNYGEIITYLTGLEIYYAEAGASLELSGDSADAQQCEQLASQTGTQIAQYEQASFAAVISAETFLRDFNASVATQLPLTAGFTVVGGRNFPQNTPICIDVSGARFIGTFSGDSFSVQQAEHPEAWLLPFQVQQAELDNKASLAAQFPVVTGFTVAAGGGIGGGQPYSFNVPTGNMPQLLPPVAIQLGPFFAQAGAAVHIATTFPTHFLPQYYSYTGFTGDVFVPEALTQDALAGTPEPIDYVASITPGTVLSVCGMCSLNGVQRLIPVPPEYYTISVQNFPAGISQGPTGPTSVNATIITVTNPLSTLPLYNFSDDLYVTFQADVGSNTVDAIRYLIEGWSALQIDEDSFAACHTALANYPSNFTISERKQLIGALQEICFQARLGIQLKGGTFYLQYLPAQPTSVATFTESDIATINGVSSLKVTYSATEELVTKLVASWIADGSQPNPNSVVVRYNIGKYGLHELDYDWYLYNNADVILKAVTFWIIRKSQTWKHAQFSTALHMLNVEAFDGVTLNFANHYVANQSVLGLVQKATYNSDTNLIDFDIWTPVVAGTMVPHPFSYPADVDPALVYPINLTEEAGQDSLPGLGIYLPGTGIAPLRPLGNPNNQFNVTFDGPQNPYGYGLRRYSSLGASKPSDVNDQNPGNPIPPTSGSLNPSAPPPPIIQPRYSAPPTPIQTSQPDVSASSAIDIHKTKITDSKAGTSSTLDTIIKAIQGGKLQISTASQFSDGTNVGPFAFQFDADATAADDSSDESSGAGVTGSGTGAGSGVVGVTGSGTAAGGTGGQFGAGVAFLSDDAGGA